MLRHKIDKQNPIFFSTHMDSLISRLDAAKELMATAEKLYYTDCEESTIVAKAAEAILKRVNEGLKQFLEKRTMSITQYEELIAGTEPPSYKDGCTCPIGHEPPREEDDTLTITTASANARRNFTAWATSMNLQSGHLLYFGDVPFRLAYDKGRATLSTQTRAGKTIVGYSASGAIKAYLKSIGSNQTNVDGWKRMSMLTEKGDSHPIGWPEWVLRVWDIQASKFKLIDE
jgi:hypothetical protein